MKTGKYSIADAYIPEQNTAIEVKSVAHGSSALKGVVQASMYKEQVRNAILCMQRPKRRPLRNGIEGFCDGHGVGLIWIEGIPTICSEDNIVSATGGNPKPFEMWKQSRYSLTRDAIISRSNTQYIKEYIDTLESIVSERHDEIFDFVLEPDANVGGFLELY